MAENPHNLAEITARLSAITAELCTLAYKEEVISDKLSELSHEIEGICDNLGKLMREQRREK